MQVPSEFLFCHILHPHRHTYIHTHICEAQAPPVATLSFQMNSSYPVSGYRLWRFSFLLCHSPHLHTYTYIRAYLCTYTHTYIHKYIHTYIVVHSTWGASPRFHKEISGGPSGRKSACGEPPAKRTTGLFYPRSAFLCLSGPLWASLHRPFWALVSQPASPPASQLASQLHNSASQPASQFPGRNSGFG